jgi:hypothetical protein
MPIRRYVSLAILIGIFFLPAIIALFCAWTIWSGKGQPQISEWRRRLFQMGLIGAPSAMLLLAPASGHYLETLTLATGIPLKLTLGGIVIWAITTVAALAGKGWSRSLLVCWAVFLFLGEFFIYLQMP